MAEIPSIFVEDECQAACAAFSSCVSYNWASERAAELGIEPYLCQLFTSCHRSYDALQRVSSGVYAKGMIKYFFGSYYLYADD